MTFAVSSPNVINRTIMQTITLTSSKTDQCHPSKNMQLSLFQTKLILLPFSPRGKDFSDVSAENTRR
jgi:hypothetical protein